MRRVALTVCLLWLGLLLVASRNTGLSPAEGPTSHGRYAPNLTQKIAYMSDTHWSEGQTQAGIDTADAKLYDELAKVASWGAQELLLGGDLSRNDDDQYSGQSSNRCKAVMDSFVAANHIPIYIALGNHDVDKYLQGTTSDTIAAGHDPFAETEALMSAYFPATSPTHWYTKDFGIVRLVTMQDDVDTTASYGGNWRQVNANSNPPGKDRGYFGGFGNQNYTNPDYEGFTDTNSVQCRFAKAAVLDARNKGELWTIVMMHEGQYPAYNNSEGDRPVQLRTRNGIIASLIRGGAQIFLEGHFHVTSIVGPVYKSAKSTSPGAYFFQVHSSGYADRSLDATHVPSGSLLYPTDASGIEGCGHLLLLSFTGRSCYLELWKFHHNTVAGIIRSELAYSTTLTTP